MKYDDIFINKMLDADCKCCAGIGIAPFGGDMHPFVVGFQTLPQFLIEKKKKKKNSFELRKSVISQKAFS